MTMDTDLATTPCPACGKRELSIDYRLKLGTDAALAGGRPKLAEAGRDLLALARLLGLRHTG